MKKELSELTAAEFIALAGGDTSVLSINPLTDSPALIADVTRNILLEFRQIADPTGIKRYYLHAEAILKARSNLLFFAMCKDIISAGLHFHVRNLFIDYGIKNVIMDNSRLEAEVESRFNRAKKDLEKLSDGIDGDDEPGNPKDIRRQFDAQTAAMMAHFKFHIDTSSIRANIYAHLLAQYKSEMKEMIRHLSRKGKK